MKHLKTLLLILAALVMLVACGAGVGGDDKTDPGNNPTTVNSASGTYSYDSSTGELTLEFTDSSYDKCGPKLGKEYMQVTTLTETTLEWVFDDDSDDISTLTRNSGTFGDIAGAWSISEHGNTFVVTFGANNALTVTGKIVSCDDDDDDDGGSDSPSPNPAPDNYIATASGTYSYNEGMLILDFTSSDSNECGPGIGIESIDLVSLTATTMNWNMENNCGVNWTRSGETAENLVGSWSYADEQGVTYSITFNSDGSVSVTGIMENCEYDIIFNDHIGCASSDGPLVSGTANGTYEYNSDNADLTFNFTSSSFGCGIDAGAEETKEGVSITATTLNWVNNGSGETNFTRIIGTAGDILGEWVEIDEGSNLTLTFKDDNSFALAGSIYCDGDDGSND